MGGVEGWWMLTTLATFGVLTGSLRKRAHGKHSFSVNFEPRDLIFLPNWRWEQGLSFQPALFFEICSSWGSIFSPRMPRTCQKRVSFLGGRCGIDEVLPDPIFFTSVRSDGPREFATTPKRFPPPFLAGLSLGLIVLKTPCVASFSGPPPWDVGRMTDFFGKVSGCVAIRVRSVCVKFRGYTT